MKLLVTGGAGFIGSNFIYYWLKNHPDDDIVNLDNLTYAGNLENLRSIQNNPHYRFIKGDICNVDVVTSAMHAVDVVVHFAAESHVDRSILSPSIFVMSNVVGTQTLLDAALKQKVKRFHHISTDEVYGTLRLGSREKFNEDSSYYPRSPYSATKAASDHLVRRRKHPDPARKRVLSKAKISLDLRNIDYCFLAPDYMGTRIDNRDTKDYWLLPRLANPLIKYLLINVLGQEGGCLAHAAGIKIKDTALAFVGPSESGKSTMAGFFSVCQDALVLTDENLAIRRKGGGFFAYGTPWPGGARVARQGSAVLKRVFFISHGKANIIRPVSASEAFKKIIAQSMLSCWDGALANSTIDFIRGLSKGVECFDLEFVNDKSVVTFLRNNFGI